METNIVLGQGLSGSALAWQLHWQGIYVHVIDRGSPITASRIAAGLITPITGRRLTKSDDFDENLAFAEEFYHRVESEVGESLLDRRPAARLFLDDAERAFFLSERLESLRTDVVLMSEDGDDSEAVGFWMRHAARLRVVRYLELTRDYFADRGQYHQADVPLSSIRLQDGGVRLDQPALTASRLYFCQGYQSEKNPWFPNVPDAPARGEILTVKIPSRSDLNVIHRGYWIAPFDSPDSSDTSGAFIVGATYDRDNLTELITDAGRNELLAASRLLTSADAEIVRQTSAVRASTKQRRAVFERHPEHPQLAILNGMGSRASLWSPLAAKRLIETMSVAPASVSTSRLKPKSLTTLAHNIVRRVLSVGDKAIDATAGNGHDTVFLAKCVGHTGQVMAIDVQPPAIKATRDRLEANMIDNVDLLHGDHGQILRQLADERLIAMAIMFNLGYLPGGDKQQTTSPDSTLMAIEASLQILSPGGVMTVTAYRGHSGGQQEAAAVADFVNGLGDQSVSVDVIPGAEDNSDSPVLFVFRK